MNHPDHQEPVMEGSTGTRGARTGPIMASLAILAILGAVGYLMIQAGTRPTVSLEQIGRLASAGRFDQALDEVEAGLRSDPENSALLVMAAELALDAPQPRLDVALARARQVRSADTALQARAKLAEGKALYLQLDYKSAEACWLEALRLDPRVPEAAWALLDLYYLEGRHDEARLLAIHQHAVEPDPRDRVRFLTELVRQDAEPPDPASLIPRFENVVRAHADDLHASLALGLALVRNSRAEEGLQILEDAVQRFPEELAAWDALLDALDVASQPERLAASWSTLPPALRDHARMARHAGNIAQARANWPAAAVAYHRACDSDPADLTSAYRLARSLHAQGHGNQAAKVDRRVREGNTARSELAELYRQISSIPDLGLRPQPALFSRIAENRERLGHRDEARAWYQLVRAAQPNDPRSRQAPRWLE